MADSIIRHILCIDDLVLLYFTSPYLVTGAFIHAVLSADDRYKIAFDFPMNGLADNGLRTILCFN